MGRACFTVSSAPNHLFASSFSSSSSSSSSSSNADEAGQGFCRILRCLNRLIALTLVLIKLLIIEARNITHVICSLPHHLSPPHPDDQELRLSPSQFPPGTIYPAATEGWMAPRPIASSGKLNITHIYPNTVTQQRGHKIQNRRTFEARKIDV